MTEIKKFTEKEKKDLEKSCKQKGLTVEFHQEVAVIRDSNGKKQITVKPPQKK